MENLAVVQGKTLAIPRSGTGLIHGVAIPGRVSQVLLRSNLASNEELRCGAWDHDTRIKVLDGDGNLYTDNLRAATQRVEYILAGDEARTVFEPHFTFQGVRYVAVEGYPGEPTLDDLTGGVIQPDSAGTGGGEAADQSDQRGQGEYCGNRDREARRCRCLRLPHVH